LIGEIESGADPSADRRADRRAQTFGELAADYLEHHAKPSKRRWQEDERILNRDLLPRWRNRKVSEIARADVQSVYRSIKHGSADRKAAPIMANRTFALVRKIFNYAINELHLIEASPCDRLKPDLAAERACERSRFLSNDEIRAFWRALDAEEAAGQFRDAALFRLELLTGQRDGEVRKMRWKDISDEPGKGLIWTIPGEFTKNRLDHRVPLAPTAAAIVAELNKRNRRTRESVNELRTKKKQPLYEPTEWVFPSGVRGGKDPIGKLPKAFERIRKASGIAERFTRHDLRRTLSTKLPGDLKISSDIVNKITNHVEPGVTKVYDRYSYDDEKIAALAKWDAFIQRVASEAAPQAASATLPVGPKRAFDAA
jgi:integrase